VSHLETGIHEELKERVANAAAHNGNGKAEPKKKPLFELMASVT
jgi:hypothetical protein